MRVKSHFRDLGSWKLDWRMYTRDWRAEEKADRLCGVSHGNPEKWVQSSVQTPRENVSGTPSLAREFRRSKRMAGEANSSFFASGLCGSFLLTGIVSCPHIFHEDFNLLLSM